MNGKHDHTTAVCVQCILHCVHTSLNSDMDYRIFNVHTDVNGIALRGCSNIMRESALKVDCGRKIPCLTRELNLCQRYAGPTFCQLSYIPTPA